MIFYHQYRYPIVFLTGLFLGMLSTWIMLNWDFLLLTVKPWQEFYGALLAALVAVLLFVLTEWSKSKEGHEEHLHLLHRSIGTAISNLASIDDAIAHFATEKLSKMINGVETHIQEGRISIDYAFVPLLHVFEFNEILLSKSSGSGYVDRHTIYLLNASKELRKIIDDVNRQFEIILNMNKELVLSQANLNKELQSVAFKNQLASFYGQLQGEFQDYIRNYAVLLIKAQIGVGKLQIWGVSRWRYIFSNIDPERIDDEIDIFFGLEYQRRIKAYQDDFKTKLTK